MTLPKLNDYVVFVDNLDHPEGVTWGPDGHVYAGGEAGQIYCITLDGEVTEVGSTGGFILGLCLDAQANVYACDLNHKAVMRITPAGEVSTYSSGAPERKLAVPNYPVFDAQGNLYVSDSGDWKGNNGCLFRIRPGGSTGVLTSELSQFPNGLALSPDGAYLYVVLSNTASVVRAALDEDGGIGPPETVVELPKTVPDGLAFDALGNLYISCYTPDIVYRLSSGGDLQVVVEDWESTLIASPTNIAFAGADLSTLVVASLSRWHLAKAQLPVVGQPLHYPDLS
ncbi:MAG: SMP-30/gluconolactonase/LRE family protein [Trueperaceae bacterium]|nr:MAG: SMP-30/gluconolactonase/LRE family protein [Trueperaceae bacterium]